MAHRLRKLTVFAVSWAPSRTRNLFGSLGTRSRCIHSLLANRSRRRDVSTMQSRFHEGGGRRLYKKDDNVKISHSELNELSSRLLHPFKNKLTLATAITHKSLTSAISTHEVFAEIRPMVVVRLTENNEKLEFIGDRVLGLLVAEHLTKNYEKLTEGQLAQAMSHMVSNKSFSRYCRTLRLADFLITAYNVRVIRNSSQPGNFFEALFGALYIDGGLSAAQKFFNKNVVPLLELRYSAGNPDDSKRLLQEHLVAHGLPGSQLEDRLQYVQVSHEQGAGKQSFTQAVHLLGKRLSIGTASSRTRADQKAAARLLNNLKKSGKTACILIRLARNVRDDLVLQKAQEMRKREPTLSNVMMHSANSEASIDKSL